MSEPDDVNLRNQINDFQIAQKDLGREVEVCGENNEELYERPSSNSRNRGRMDSALALALEERLMSVQELSVTVDQM